MALIPTATDVLIGRNIDIVSTREQPTRTYKIDYENNCIVGYTDGSDAMKQAILKILLTERFDHLMYSWNYGVECRELVGKSFQVFVSEAKRVVSEALLEDRRITELLDMVVTKVDKSSAMITFTAVTVFGKIEIETKIGDRGIAG